MLRGRVLMILVAAATIVTACGEPEVERTVTVGALDVDDVRSRALAAVRDGGDIFHYAEPGEDDAYRVEAWLDLERVLARQDINGQQRQTWDGERTAFVGGPGDVFVDALFTTDFEPPVAVAIPYLGHILSPAVEVTRIDEAVVDGDAAIAVHVRQKRYERAGYDEWTIYLDESFLPLRIDEGGEVSDVTYEFIDRTALPGDFFSSEPLRAMGRKPTDALEEAEAAGMRPYWVGEAFEDLRLHVESRWVDDEELDRLLHLSYGPEDPMIPSPCAHVYEYSADDWEVRVRRFGRDDREPQPGERVIGNVEVAGLRGRMYAGPNIMLPLTPSGEPRIIDPESGEEIPPGPSGLPRVPDDEGGSRRAVLEGDGIVVEVAANCGPAGSNVYRTDDGLRRLVEALRPYE